jgi:hypothetical protein
MEYVNTLLATVLEPLKGIEETVYNADTRTNVEHLER